MTLKTKASASALTLDANPYGFLTLTYSPGSVPEMTLDLTSATVTTFAATNYPWLVIEASLVELPSNTETISFRGLFFHDCSQVPLDTTASGEARDYVVSTGSTAISGVPQPVLNSSKNPDTVCTIDSVRLHHNVVAGSAADFDPNLLSFN